MTPQNALVMRTAVERIVRPIDAGERQKLRMRQDLYAHAIDAYEHERAAGASEDAAAQSAAARLGHHDEIRQELQHAVSLRDRVDGHLERFVRRPPDRPLVLHAAKLGIALGLAIAAFLVLLSSVPYFFGVTKCNGEVCTVETLLDVWPQLGGMAFRLSILFSLAAFNFALIGSLAQEAFRRTSRPSAARWRGAVKSVSAALVALGVESVAMNVAPQLNDGTSSLVSDFLEGVFWLGFFTAITAAPLLPLMWLRARRARAHAEWQEIRLPEAAIG